MTLADLATVASIVSSAAVALSLIYLGLQVHQNTKHTRALIHQGRVARVSDIHLNFAAPHMAEAWLKAEGLPVTPDEISRRQLSLIGLIYDVSWEDNFLQHELGLFAGDQFADFRAHVVEFLKNQGLRDYFSKRPVPSTGPTKYHKFIVGLVAEASASVEKAS